MHPFIRTLPVVKIGRNTDRIQTSKSNSSTVYALTLWNTTSHHHSTFFSFVSPQVPLHETFVFRSMTFSHQTLPAKHCILRLIQMTACKTVLFPRNRRPPNDTSKLRLTNGDRLVCWSFPGFTPSLDARLAVQAGA